MSFQWECQGQLHISPQALASDGIGDLLARAVIWERISFDDRDGVLTIAYDEDGAAGDVHNRVLNGLRWLAKLGAVGTVYGSNSEDDHWRWVLRDGKVFRQQAHLVYEAHDLEEEDPDD